VNDLSFFYYGMVCVSLTLLGLLLTVLEFHRMSPGKNPSDQRLGCARAGGGESKAAP
jgi:hypothetical protein